MHPNGAAAGIRLEFNDVNPPCTRGPAGACTRSPGATRGATCLPGANFSEATAELHMVGQSEDVNGKQIFGGGFLGLDNISLFRPLGSRCPRANTSARRMAPRGCVLLPRHHALDRAWSWRGTKPAYEDIASKFSSTSSNLDAMNTLGGTGLWNEGGWLYYTRYSFDGQVLPLRVRSLVGLVPLLAVEVLDQHNQSRSCLASGKRMRWFIHNRPDLSQHISYLDRKSDSRRPLRAAACWRCHRRTASCACCAMCWMKTNFSRRTACGPSRALTRRSPYNAHLRPARVPHRLRAGRIDEQPLRRQFKLARPDLDAAELSPDRGA